ncbi:hypothetical protein K2173_019764 [Erythroxylum novogranatense]|uniref:Uncharacterized protein n=1 Tax=Erythroxylum novogranatense TaxID=1862640 RepID=A0AAV8SMV4_9ROSI|nr:hypothetical protein K2173_019764 [Erythroxylum novogranatense]
MDPQLRYRNRTDPKVDTGPSRLPNSFPLSSSPFLWWASRDSLHSLSSYSLFCYFPPFNGIAPSKKETQSIY